MQNHCSYIMRDQVHDRVFSIMAHELPQPHNQEGSILRNLLISVSVMTLYILALTTSG